MSLDVIKNALNRYLELGGKESWQVARTTTVTALGLYYACKGVATLREQGLAKTLVAASMNVMNRIPLAAGKIDEETQKTIKKLEENLINMIPEDQKHHYVALPKQGIEREEILELISERRSFEDHKWKDGQVSGTVYHGDSEFQAFLSKVYGMFALSNPLHPDVFPYTRKMEAEVVRMTCSLFHGDDETCGSISNGGTDSILLACITHRDWGRKKFGIKEPEMITCTTAHAAFEKAAHYFGIKLIQIPPNPDTFKIDPKEVQKHITANTILIVSSGPNYPQGVIDPIKELSDIVLQHEHIGLHVDCCLGGFLLPFLEKIGVETPLFDFRVPGVTSISADTHKYGYSPKGTSVVMYRSHELRRYQYFVSPDWMGGVYATPTFSGSRAGGLIAATWAALVAMGEEGYKECAREIVATVTAIKEGIHEIPGLCVLGDPIAPVVAFGSNDKRVNIHMVGEAMGKHGWNLNSLQHPSCIHICCTFVHRNKAQHFLSDLRDSARQAREEPETFKADGHAALYGMAELLPPGSVVLQKIGEGYVDSLYKL